MHADGQFLTRLDLAFSRDQDRKIYVQDKMLEQAPLFWSWLQDGACVYVSAWQRILTQSAHHRGTAGRYEQENGNDYVQPLKDEHRYHRDVY